VWTWFWCMRRAGALATVCFLIFWLVTSAPGASLVGGLSTSPEENEKNLERLRADFHLDEPVIGRFCHFLGDLATGRLCSWAQPESVLRMVGRALAYSLPAFLVGLGLAWLAAFPAGVWLASARRSRGATAAAMTLCLVVAATPAFVGAVVFKALAEQVLGLDIVVPVQPTVEDRLRVLLLPALMVFLSEVAVLLRQAREAMAKELASPYADFARAKGLTEEEVARDHALPNTRLVFITLFGLALPGAVGGAVISESVLGYPGMGTLTTRALFSQGFLDVPVVATVAMLTGALVLAGSAVAEWLYLRSDPRLCLPRGET
jgi:ABC-type dipeptide/oligopeptide/nickel transport system permease component